MTLDQGVPTRASVNRAVEVSIHVGLLILLVTACLLILYPFIPLVTWGIIIAVAAHPGFQKLQRLLNGRAALAGVVFTLILLAVVIVPAIFLGQSVVEGAHAASVKFRSGASLIPPPPSNIEGWPMIGSPLKGLWTLASKDLTELIRKFGPQIKAALPGVLSASAGIGLTVLQLLLSIIVSGVLLASARASQEVVQTLFNRLFGENGPEFQQLVEKTIRSITFGILGVALIQSLFAAVGFFVAGVPAASLWSAIFLIGAILQVGGLVLIPAVVYVFATASTTTALIFLVWCVFVGVLDNVLKPMLLGRGVAVPMVVILLGAFGGMFAMGIIGLFIGAVVLSVGYKLFLAWLKEDAVSEGAA
jgi:predicted PurR-regulated permease PerM